MSGLFSEATRFIETWNVWIVAISLAMAVISIAAVPYLVSALPADYFTHRGRQRMSRSNHHPAIRMTLTAFKNLLGAVMLMIGFIMLFTPGQGSLTILFGLIIMNYPGKYRLERWIIGKPAIFKAVNAIRARQGKEPLLPPESV